MLPFVFCSDTTLAIAAGRHLEDVRHERLVAVEVLARPDVVWLAATDRRGRWLGTDPHGRAWAAWDGRRLVDGSWRLDDPPRWARALVTRVTRAIPVEAIA